MKGREKSKNLFPRKLLETMAIVVRNISKKKLGKTDLFRHCETTPVAPYEAMVVFFGVIGSFEIKLYSWSGLVGAFLQAENGRFVTVMRIANTNYHFRHCDTSPGVGKPVLPNLTKLVLNTTAGTRAWFLFFNFKQGFAFLSNSICHKVFDE